MKRRSPGLEPRATSTTPIAASESTAYVEGLHRRRAASCRIVGGDPWRYEPPIAGYELAAAHLCELGLTPGLDLPALRSMWKAGGEPQRLAQVIAERWVT